MKIHSDLVYLMWNCHIIVLICSKMLAPQTEISQGMFDTIINFTPSKSPITLGIRQSPDPPDPKNLEIGCKVVA